MAVNAASSTYVNNASSSNGFSGLASGIDTESMVEQLLSGTQSKIDKQEGLKQQIQWKQEIYRNIISQINAFQTKFFSYSSSYNLASSSFWNSLSVFANSSAFKATATSSAATGSSSISVRRLATKTTVTSGKSVSGDLSGKLDASALEEMAKKQLDGDYTVKFKVGSANVDVDLKDVFVSEDGNTFVSYGSTPELDSAIQKKLQDAFNAAETGVKVTVSDGAVSIVSSGDNRKSISVSSDSGELGLKKLGLAANSSSVDKSSSKTATLSGTVDAAPKMEFTVTLDDLKKTVSIDLRDVMDENGGVDGEKLQQQLKAGIDKVHGKDQILVKYGDDGSISFAPAAAGRKVDIGGSDEVMKVLGMKNGASNRISLGSKLSDLNLGTALRGDSYRFTINGEEFHFTGDTAIIDVMDVINRSDAGVRMVYRAQDDKFVLEAREFGAGREINMKQTEGNLLNALFGGSFDIGSITSKKLTNFEPPATKGLTFTLPTVEEPEDGGEVEGEGEVEGDGEAGDVEGAEGEAEDGDEAGQPEAKTLDNVMLSELLTDSEMESELYELLGLEEDILLADLMEVSGGKYFYSVEDGKITIMQTLDENTTLEDLGYTLGDIPGETTLAELAAATDGKMAFDAETGKITLEGYFAEEADEDTANTLEELFGRGTALGKVDEGELPTVWGQNAEVEVDGIVTERGTNNFTINGVNYDITDITGSYSDVTRAYAEAAYDEAGGKYTYADGDGNEVEVDPADLIEMDGKLMFDLGYYLDENGSRVADKDLVDLGGELKKFTGSAATVTVKQDTDTIINSLKEFIDEYNVLVKTLNDLLDEDTNYRDYAPLTSAQKAEMSEREIQLWEEKAKEGLLHRDNTIQTFLQEMRTALYQKPEGAKYALYELGIETGEWEQKGQLSFVVGGEANLRNLLENDPSGVASLFTSVSGLGTTLNNILKQTASTSSGSPGTLVQIAGIKDSDTSSSMYNQLKAIDEKIEALKRTYEMEKTRYWNQFNTMEQMISNMNTQSAYLYQMMGMNY